MADHTLNMYKGIYSRLAGFSGVSSLVGTRIYRNVVKQQTFPFIHMRATAEETGDKDTNRLTYTLTIQAFSQKAEPDEALNIRAQIYEALHNKEANISITNANIIMIDAGTLSDCFLGPDGITWQAPISFNLTLEDV